MAYAAVISVMHTIQRLKFPINRKITKSAYEELDSLRSILKKLDARKHRSMDRSVINELDEKIREAVWKLEDALESSLIPPSQGLEDKSYPMIEIEIESCLKTVKMLREEYSRELKNSSPAKEDEAAAVLPIHKSTTVGFSDLSERIRNELLHGAFRLKTVSLVGMAGIGKTHLAREIYQHQLILRDFDSRLWVRVGPKYQITQNILVDIVAQIESKPRDLFKEYSSYSLRCLIKEKLRGRRYLIVLDDIWSTQVFDYFKELFIDYDNQSRFLLTTRLQEVARYYWKAKINQMPFLNNEESWNLLWQNVFAETSFPSQLEKAGRKIAQNCEGLPLLILAVANILCGLDKTEEYWNKVAEKKTTTFTDAYDQIYEILLSSYEYLPQHLKPYFLCMGVFPQSCEIPISKLINLCVVEDFLEPNQHTNLEHFAMECTEDLVSKSLVIVCKRRFRGMKFSKLHSAYWHLCVTEARKNKFFHVLKKLTDATVEKPRRLSVQNNMLFGIKEVSELMVEATSTTRSLLFTGEDHRYPVPICFNMMRMLDALPIRLYEFPNEVLNLLQLRYLALTHNGELPSSISKLQQLQCLILRRHHNIKFPTAPTTYLPEEIWDMKELMHLRIVGSNLPDPSKGAKLPKLLKLYVNADSCTQHVFGSIPRLKRLGIKIELQPDAAETIRCLEHIGFLKRLESLKCVVVNPRLRSQVVAPPDHHSNLPRRVKKLSLNGLGYSWKYMSSIGSLPNLQVLKLRCSAFQGVEWETEAVQFRSLEFLLLEDMDLVHWINYKCFDGLQHLIVRHCYKLKSMPRHIERIGTLVVDDCNPSFVASAQQINSVINSSWNLR